MGTHIYTPTIENGNLTSLKRVVHKTTTGVYVAVVADVGFIYIFTSTDGNTWTQSPNNQTTNVAATDYIILSSCLAANNDLKIAYRNGNSDIRYVTVPFNAATGTYGVFTNNSALYTSSATPNMKPVAIDIDTAGITNHKWTVVTAHMEDKVSSPMTTWVYAWVLDESGATPVVYSYTEKLASKRSVTSTEDIAMSCRKVSDGATLTTIGFVLVITNNWTTGDGGDSIRALSFNTSTHAFTKGPTKAISSAGKGIGRRRYITFSPEGSGKFYIAGGTPNNWWYAYCLSWDGVSSSWTTVSAESINTTSISTLVYAAQDFIGFAMAGNRIFFFSQDTSNALEFKFVTFMSDGSITWNSTNNIFDKGPGSNYDGPIQTKSGGQRNFDTRLTTMIYYDANRGSGTGTRSVRMRQLLLSLAPTVTKPSAGASVATSYPDLEAAYHLAIDDPQVPYQMQWQIASDSAFTTNVQTFATVTTHYTNPNNTYKGGADVRELITVASRIASGSWYIRAASVDVAGNVGAWSAAQAFAISHPPTASSPAPDNDSIVPYGTGTVSFSWAFSDPSPDDYQSGYDIVITDPSTGSTVVNTGFVASTTNGGSVTIPATYKDKELNWQVTVYDQDGTAASVASVIAAFYASDPPAPTIQSPANGGTITSGRPTVLWSANLGSNKTQDSFRVKVTQGVNTLFDSGFITGTDSSYQIPPGILHNNNNYTVTVTVKDSLGQTGKVSSSFTTSYTPPNAPIKIRCFTYEFNRYGFAYIGWDYGQMDPDFSSWNLYRQEIGQPSPILLASIGELRPTYGFRDYSAKANTRYRYWVTQVVNRFGDVIESAPGAIGSVTTPTGNYWLLDSVGISDPVPLYGVTADGWTDENEEAVLNVLGRGRHVDIGTAYGENGTLSGQLRDKYMEIMTAGNNWISNSALQYAADGVNPDGWSITSGTSVTGMASRYDTYLEPAPCAKSQIFVIGVDSAPAGYGNNGVNAVQLLSDSHNVIDTDWVAGSSVVSIGLWLAQPPDLAQAIEVRAWIQPFDSSGKALPWVGGLTAVVDNYEPSSSLDPNKGQWSRWAIQNLALPAGTVTYKIACHINGVNALNGAYFYIGGVSVNTGSKITSYMDGDMRGAGWVTAIGGTSYSTGFYTARQQRLDVEAMKALGRPLFLRTPFGDVLLVSLGDPSNTRQPGIGGGADFADLSLPYREIAY